MLYRTTHTTLYTYEGPVSHCLSEARLTPRILASQELLEWNLLVTPKPAGIVSHRDYFGNDVSSFAVLEPHDQFTVTASCLVDVKPRPHNLGFSPTCEEARAMIAECEDPESLKANEFVWESSYVPWVPELAEYASMILSSHKPLAEAAADLMHQIYEDFDYKPESTSVETPILEAFQQRQGVCQDFAHVMIGALRAHRLAARYVSGYLRMGSEFQGAQASHAWVSVFIPGSGWLDFDPTNDVMPSTSHITLAWGRDYGDVPPVKGITIGGGQHTLDVEVLAEPV